MTKKVTIWNDWIDAIFKPVVGFFAGMVIGHTAELASISNWWIALGVLAIISIGITLFFAIERGVDRGIGRFFDWTIGSKYPGGIKPSDTPHKPHWFVRFGWFPALLLGLAAVLVLPEGALAWLI